MREYYLVDRSHNRNSIKKLRVCEVAANLWLYKGPNFTEEDIRELWKYPDICPAPSVIKRIIKHSNIKWFIHTRSDQLLRSNEWNPDFLMGLIKWGKTSHFKYEFPSFEWFGNSNLATILKQTPFFGIFTYAAKKYSSPYRWAKVPALCLDYSEDSIHFMAGVLSSGIVVNKKNKCLVRYNKKIASILMRWNIPIEFQNDRGTYISPFWPVLLSKYMPSILETKWRMIKDAYKAKEYSAILWKIYTGKDPIKNGIPYLCSRRTVFYRYGSIKNLEPMWLENNLVNLDARFKKIIQEWDQKKCIMDEKGN